MKRSFLPYAITSTLAVAVAAASMALALQPDKPKPTPTVPAKPSVPAKPLQPPKTPDKPAAPSPEDMKKMLEEMTKLTPEHERLKGFVGTWTAEVKNWMNPMATEPSLSKGEMVNTLIHGGKFVHHEYKGEVEGMQFTGSGDWGYDKDLKRYEGTWMDNFDNMIMYSTGTYDAATSTYTSTAEFEMANPVDGQVAKVKQRETVKIEGPDKHVMLMYHQMPGAPETKVMEITYTRKK
jgi:hypothetical protein